ncbi:MAG: UDP-3-O-acyl-N-acetylglucosamine deacetylase [Bdellovibrionales bacterium]|nr:UDP-3-O-acyl-N-acetylglucosamine deacetylase [Bdellovibrionales bacterium]
MSYLRTTLESNGGDAAFRVGYDEIPGAVIVEGRGLHSGKLFRLTISVANEANHGIVFAYERDEVTYSSPAFWLRVSGTSRATALILRGESRRRFELFTVEHFLSAALVAGRHDLLVQIETPEGPTDVLEFPNLDGSAAEWFRILSRLPETPAALTERPCWKIIRSVEVADGSRKVVFSPLSEPGEESISRYDYTVRFGDLNQTAFFEIDWRRLSVAQGHYAASIAPARTFGFKAELEALEKRGLAKGATLANALLLDGSRVVNEGGFKIPNELAAHKLMDAVGDLFLLGAPFLGRVDFTEAGHSMHLRALEEAFRTGALVKGRLLASGPFLRE